MRPVFIIIRIVVAELLLYFAAVIAIQYSLAYMTGVTVAHAKEHNTALLYLYSYGGGLLVWLSVHTIISRFKN